MQKHLKTLAYSGTVAAIGCASAWAQSTLYDDSGLVNGAVFAMSNGQAVGNEVTAAAGTAWSLSQFVIEYDNAGSSSLSATAAVDVNFYANDGATINGFYSPGTLLYSSGAITLGSLGGAGTGPENITYTTSDFAAGATGAWNPQYTVPNTFTFTVTFTGLQAGDDIELPLANSVNNGTAESYGTYWFNDNGAGWQYLQYNGGATPANLEVQLEGTITSVPEPTTLGMAAVGGALLFGAGRLRRKI